MLGAVAMLLDRNPVRFTISAVPALSYAAPVAARSNRSNSCLVTLPSKPLSGISALSRTWCIRRTTRLS